MPPAGTTFVKATSSFDLPLIRTIGKAFYWQKVIDTGEVANATELARRFNLEPGWVSKVLRMTRLAPDTIRSVLDGRQPRHLNLRHRQNLLQSLRFCLCHLHCSSALFFEDREQERIEMARIGQKWRARCRLPSARRSVLHPAWHGVRPKKERATENGCP